MRGVLGIRWNVVCLYIICVVLQGIMGVSGKSNTVVVYILCHSLVWFYGGLCSFQSGARAVLVGWGLMPCVLGCLAIGVFGFYCGQLLGFRYFSFLIVFCRGKA